MTSLLAYSPWANAIRQLPFTGTKQLKFPSIVTSSLRITPLSRQAQSSICTRTLMPVHLSSSPSQRLSQIQKNFSTTSRMAKTNNDDFQLSELFDVKGKVGLDCFWQID